MIEELTPEAKDDLYAAGAFYESQRAGLGYEFAVEVGRALSTIAEAPHRWPEIEPGVRKFRLARFPYAILYEASSSKRVTVVAVFDLRRQPGSWKR